jgi:hypothetical protein
MLPSLTGYTWNADAHRYRGDDGRFVSGQTIRDSLENLMDQSALNMNALTQSLIDGNISLASWQSSMMAEIKASHVAASALANGGWSSMTSVEWGATGQMIREQYDYLRNFANEIASGTQALDGRALVRADLYGDAANGTYAQMQRRTMILEGMEEERRILEASDGNNCDGCLEQAALGWQPIGTLDQIGEEECQTRCRCEFSYRKMTDTGEWEESE